MSTCGGCGGVVGRDCFNPQECEWIMRDQDARYQALQSNPDDRCQGCGMIAGFDVYCLGLCDGAQSDADIELRRRAFASIKTIAASGGDQDA